MNERRRRGELSAAATADEVTPATAIGAIDRFQLHHLLKQGGGVATYSATDTRNGSPVILKTVVTSGLSTAVRFRLQHEADVLERLDATVRPLVASGTVDGLFYLVQRHLPGRSLQRRLEESPLALGEALALATQLLDVLQIVHDSGVLHRDIKPSNVLVSGEGEVLRAELIDFGLARSARLDGSVREELVGTARYAAPEAAGLIDLVVDERSDLYSLGAVLVECLTGEPMFDGETVGAVLRQHLNAAPPSLRALGIDVPRALDAALQRLLAKDPDARYQSAASALADFTEIARAIAAGSPNPP